MQQPAPNETTATSGLVELAAPIAKQAADLFAEGSPNDAASLRARHEELFRVFEGRAIRAGYTEAETFAAKYALTAMVDEGILMSEHPAKDEWLGRPLQMVFFDDFSAGEEFYVKLDAIRTARSPRTGDVLEVFHLCLALGFKGKYGDARGVERRRVLMDAIAAEIAQLRGIKAGAPLSAAGLPPETQGPLTGQLRLLSSGPLWIVPVVVVVVLLILVIVSGIFNDRALASIPDEGTAGNQGAAAGQHGAAAGESR